MEGAPYFPESPEDASIETPEKKKDEKKKKRSGYEFLATDKRQEEAKKIAESLEKSPLFGERKQEKQEFEPKHLKDAEAAPEAEAPLDGLGEEEKREIVQELAAGRKREVQQELAAVEPDSPEAAEAAEVVEMLEAVEASGEIDAPAVAEELEPEEPAASAEALPFDEESEVSLADEVVEEEAADDTVAAATPPPAAGGAAGGGAGAPPASGVPGGATPPPRSGVPTAGFTSSGAPPRLVRNPNVYTSADMAVAEQQAGARGFIVGGILGYLIGRRRGRIKTEKRLLPVQHKLEKEVKGLQQQLAAREASIRTLAFERLPAGPTAVERPPLARAAPEHTARPSRLELAKPQRVERLGKAVVGAELPAEAKPVTGRIAPEQVKAMSRHELLLLSEKVVVEGASLRQIYEQHLLGERGLRRLLSEYLEGKDIHKALHEELVEREIDFERDPMLRDAALAATAGGGTASASLEQLLEKAGAHATPDDALLSVAKLQAAAKEEAAVKNHRRRQLADTAMVTLIVVLAAAVAFLLLRP